MLCGDVKIFQDFDRKRTLFARGSRKARSSEKGGGEDNSIYENTGKKRDMYIFRSLIRMEKRLRRSHNSLFPHPSRGSLQKISEGLEGGKWICRADRRRSYRSSFARFVRNKKRERPLQIAQEIREIEETVVRFLTEESVQGLAKRWAPGCVNAAGKAWQKW